MEPKFVMDPDVYDAIDLVSEMEGGLQAGSPFYFVDCLCTPFLRAGVRCGCMIGAALLAGVYGEDITDAYLGFDRCPVTPDYTAFDQAHGRVAQRLGLDNDALVRLPWPLVAAEMGVVRGEGA
jgi:hypothetical protein